MLAGTATPRRAEAIVPAGDAFVSVYRLYNPVTRNHLLTADANEAAYLPLLGWVNDGTIGFGFAGPGTSAAPASARLPVYRLFDTVNLDHVLTTDPAEAAFLASTGLFNAEGVVAYVLPAAGEGLAPLYRLVRDNPQKHLVTSDLNEVFVLTSVGGWRLEGVLGYVLTAEFVARI
jgi:hypothetical protein